MKLPIFARKACTGLTLLLVLSGCTLDALTVVKPEPFMPVEKATVEPVAASGTLPDSVESPAALKNNELPAVKQPTEAVPQKQPLEASVPVISNTAPAQSSVADRQRFDAAPDIEYADTVLAEDTVLHGNVQVNGWLTVPAQVTLTIEAGTAIRFITDKSGDTSSAGLLVQGRIVAIGDAERPVLLTGIYTKPQAGDWQGVVMLGSDKKNILEQCRVEGAVVALDAFHSQLTLRDFTASDSGTAIRLRDTYANIAGGGVSSCGTGIISYDSELDLRDMNLSSNQHGLTVSGGSLYLTGSTFYGNVNEALLAENSRLKVSGCSFTVNGTGVTVNGSEGTLSHNRLLNNRVAGINLSNSRLKVNGNNINQNGIIGLSIAGGNSTVWGNVISANNGHDLEYSGGSDLAIMGNWWGETGMERIMSRIRKDGSTGRVLIMPILLQRPQSVQ